MEAFEFFFVVCVAVFFDCEFLFVGVVAGVDADLLDVFGGFHRGGWEEVDIGDEGDVALGGADALGDLAECFGGFFVGCGDAHDFAADFGEGECLPDGGVDILRVGRRHGLDADRIISTHADVADFNFARGAALGDKARLAVGEVGGVRMCHFAGVL